ncbi:MAG: S41 family peptidase [Verrucomicrobiota bacterium]|nr:S41 family peptidase [Verrucomicrobiota bacterium]
MIRRFCSILAFVSATALAQSPAPTISAKPIAPALSPADAEEAIKLLNANYVDPAALKNQSLNAATLEDFLTRLHGGAAILPAKANAQIPVAFYSDIIAHQIGYARLGTLNADNLRAFDNALANFETKKIDALVIDLRATPPTNDFGIAAEFAGRVVPKGKLLWRLRKANGPEQNITNERAPLFSGPTMVLFDTETAGPAEAIAAAIREGAHAVSIGQLTAGEAVAFTDFKLPGGKTFRLATTVAIDAEGRALFPGGVKPDLSVELAPAKKQQIFSLSAQRGESNFVFETGRPHFNEASLMAGTNPELEPARKTKPEDNLHDTVLQRAVDVITSIDIFAKH